VRIRLRRFSAPRPIFHLTAVVALVRSTAYEVLPMNVGRISRNAWLPLGAALIFAACALALYWSVALAADSKLTLTADQEVPPVASEGSATGALAVGADKSVSGSVTTRGILGTAASIHEGAIATNGPAIIPLAKNGDTYSVPAGAKLTDAQFDSFQAGNLYVNVQTTVNPGGELRAQLQP
jgi:CHRD domain